MVFVNDTTDPLGDWKTIDRDRNIILKNVGGPSPEGTYWFELTVDGNVIKFSGTSGMKIHGPQKVGHRTQYDMNWHFDVLVIPEPLKREKSNIVNIIKEALLVWGYNCSQDRAYSVSVNFNPKILGA